MPSRFLHTPDALPVTKPLLKGHTRPGTHLFQDILDLFNINSSVTLMLM